MEGIPKLSQCECEILVKEVCHNLHIEEFWRSEKCRVGKPYTWNLPNKSKGLFENSNSILSGIATMSKTITALVPTLKLGTELPKCRDGKMARPGGFST